MRGSRAMPRKIESSALVSRVCKAGAVASWGAKFDHFHIQGSPSRLTRYGRLVFERFVVGAEHGFRRDFQGNRFVFGGYARIDVPESRADPLGAVTHQPVDVILAFAYVEGALQIGVAPRVLFDIRHIHFLGHVNRCVRMGRGSDPVDHREKIAHSR